MCQVIHVADFSEDIIDDVNQLLGSEEFFNSVPDDLFDEECFLMSTEPVIATEHSPVSESDYDVALAPEISTESPATVTPVHAV